MNRASRRWHQTILMLGLLLGAAAQASSGEIPPEHWLCNPLQWTCTPNALHAMGAGADMAVLQTAPVSTRVSVEADVKLVKAVGTSWKIAGVAVYREARDFWHFALVLPPAGHPQRLHCELAEMRDGEWLAQRNLRSVVDQTASEPLQCDRTYHLRIALEPEGVEGTLADSTGRVLRKIRYAFSAAAVTSGQPALRSQGIEAEFSNLAIVHRDPAPVPAQQFPAYTCASCVAEIRGQSTGFFHVEQLGTTWWVIDPLGRGFVPLGVDHATFRGHGCEKLGYAPYGRKNQAKYGTIGLWEEETLGRLRAWGFNLLGAGCSPELFHRGLAHTAFAGFGTGMARLGDAYDIMPDRGIPCSAFPNVFHPDFARYCRYEAHQFCASRANDPWLLGYFLDNELDWWGHADPDTGLFNATLRKPAGHTAKQALRDLLAERYGRDIARFNRAWGTKLASFDQILQCDSLPAPVGDAVLADKKAFVGLIAQRYFSTLAAAIHAVDPHHMILGCRFAGGRAADVVWQAAGRHCELLTFNYYGNVDLNHGVARDHFDARHGKLLGEAFQEFYGWGQRPMMVTEWSFPALDAGLPSVHGAGQRFRTQAERAKATEITARTMLALPYLVGYDYFMWVDEPAPGVSEKFPEDSNYGLVSEDGVPYPLLTAALTGVHGDAGKIRRAGPPAAAGRDHDQAPAATISHFVDLAGRAPTMGRSPDAALHFDRQGDAFTATNGSWEIRGKIGARGLTTDIQHRGQHLGRYNAMLQLHTDGAQWIDVDRLADVKCVGQDPLVVELIGCRDAPPNSHQASFEVAHRLILLPRTDWFVAQFLWCRNTSDQPMDLRAAYFRLYSNIGGSADPDVPIKAIAAPRVWGSIVGDAWWNEKAKTYWGLAAGDDDPLKIQFWLGDHGLQHPDAHFDVGSRLAPGETYRPPTPVAVLCIAGRGDRQTWETRAREVLDSKGGK